MTKIQKISLFLFTLLLALAAFLAPEWLWNSTGIQEDGLNKVTQDVEIPLKSEPATRLVVVEKPMNPGTSGTQSTTTNSLVGAYPESAVLNDGTTAPLATEATPSAEVENDFYDFGPETNPMVLNSSHSTTHRIGENGDDTAPAKTHVNGRRLSRPRTHVIMDGDTLDSLARRYLHDATRAEEIYECNKDRLHSPSELTIGTRITLPEM